MMVYFNKENNGKHCLMYQTQRITSLLVPQLSHQAFKVAQSLEPLYVNCWIGQVSESHIYQRYHLISNQAFTFDSGVTLWLCVVNIPVSQQG